MQDNNEEQRNEDHQQINLTEVYKVLTSKPWYQSKRKTLLLNKFAELLAQKSSFAHRVHKAFANMPTFPKDGYPY